MKVSCIYKSGKIFDKYLSTMIKYIELLLFLFIGIGLFSFNLGNTPFTEKLIVLFVFLGIFKSLFYPFCLGHYIKFGIDKIILGNALNRTTVSYSDIKVVKFISEDSLLEGRNLGIEIFSIKKKNYVVFFETTFHSSRNTKLSRIDNFIKNNHLNLFSESKK